MLGDAARTEWAAIRSQIDESSPSATRPAADPKSPPAETPHHHRQRHGRPLDVRMLAGRRGCEALVVVGAFLLGLCRITDPDVWTHLAHGRALVAARGLPPHEPFTFPSAAMPYYNTEWLFGVALYGAFLLGGLTAV